MKHRFKQVLSLALVLCMVFSLMCINIYAADDGTETADANDEIATIADEEDEESEELSVTVYTSDTATATFTSAASGLATSDSTNITDSSGNVIATYEIELTSTYTKYSSYSASSNAVTSATSFTSGSSYAIGSNGYYLAVDADGSLSVVTTVDEYSVWTVTSTTDRGQTTYTLHNEATGYYLAFTETTSGEGMGTTSYTALTTSTSSYSFSWDSSLGFYKSARSGSTTTYYYFTVSSSGATFANSTSSSSTGAASYLVTGSNGTTTYTYTITFTGSDSNTGTGSVVINGTTYSVTVKTLKTITTTNSSGTSVTLNQLYGWHIANIETVATSSGTSTVAVAAAQQLMSGISGVGAAYVYATKASTTTSVYGYDLATYYSDYDSSDSTATLSTGNLNVKVYGSDSKNAGTSGEDLTMAVSTGITTKKISADNNGTVDATVGDYDSSTIYDYNYITIVPENGYYVSQITIACNGTLAADAGSPYTNASTGSEISTNIAFTNELGNTDYFGTYGVGCTSMSQGDLTTTSYDPTSGTVVELDMREWIASHADNVGTEDPYFVLIEIEKIPTPLYVEYEAGDAASYVDNSTIVSTNEDYYWATETAGDNVSFALTSDDLTAIDYLYEVLDPAYTTYTDSDGTVYYFAGWEVEYFTTAADYGTEESPTYPTLSGTVTLASGTISYGSGTELYLFTHVKLVAQWTTYTFDADYVVDFGLPVTLTVADDAALTTTTTIDGVETTETTTLADAIDGYTWSVQSVASNPEYGTATVSNGTLTYTLNTVMGGTDTMQVRMVGTYTGTNEANAVYSDRYAVVNVTIYPATTVYYEEGFATYGTTWSVTGTGSWTTGSTGDTNQQTHVACDTSGDANYNNYGYDGAYASTSAASNGTQASTSTAKDSLQFTFTGTGVDIYANCTSSTGVVLISIENSDGEEEKLLTVDTADVGSYESDDSVSYNTPIASVTGLTYGEHTVTIYVSASGTTTTEDEDGSTTTTSRIGFSFDGFRVYDTIDNDKTDGSNEADTVQTTIYSADSEDYPVYTEIRNVVLSVLTEEDKEVSDYTVNYTDDLESSTTAQVYASADSGVAVYYSVTGDLTTNEDATYTWANLTSLLDDGTKNELYLPADVTLVLKLDTSALGTDENTSPRTIQVGVKSTSGTGSVKLSSESNASSVTVSSVDMFYTASVKTEDGVSYVTIANTGSSTISLTKLKASDEVTISDEAITESELTALLSSTEETGAEEETAVFEPESFTVSTSVKTSGKSATVTVTAKTSTDVESVTVNGVEVTSYKTVTERTGQGRNATVTTYRQFTYTETVTASGNYTYEVCAVDADGTASAATAATATVSIRSTQTGQANQINQNKR